MTDEAARVVTACCEADDDSRDRIRFDLRLSMHALGHVHAGTSAGEQSRVREKQKDRQRARDRDRRCSQTPLSCPRVWERGDRVMAAGTP